jgi:MFS transporter, ACS family, hexuronate transporter
METTSTTGPSASQKPRSEPPSSRFTVPGFRWWICLVLTLVTVSNYLDRSVLAVAAPTLRKEFSIDEVGFSHVIMAFQFTYLIMQPFAGRFMDWLNVRIGFGISLLWWSVAQMMTVLATGVASLGLFRSVLGIGEAANFPGAAKAVSQWYNPSERSIALGIINVGSGLGSMIAPPIVVYLILNYHWQAAFIVSGALGVALAFLWVAVYRSPEKHPWLSAKELAHIREGQHVEAAAAAGPTVKQKGVVKYVLTQPKFWSVALARFFAEPAWQFFVYWIPLYLATERHLQLKQIAYFAWVPFLAADVGSLFGGFLSPFFIRRGMKLVKARKLAVTIPAVLMVFAAFIGKAPSAGWAVFFFSVGAFSHQALSCTLLTFSTDLFTKRAVGTANGLTGSCAHLGGMLFTMVVGLVARAMGYGPLFICIACFDLIGAAILWAVLREDMAEGTILETA